MKIKRLRMYILAFFIVLFFNINFEYTKAVPNAEVSITKVTNSTVLDSKYSWGPKFIKNVTKAKFFGVTNFPKDVNKLSNGTITSIANVDSVRLTNTNQKGNIGVIYENVGTYNGDIIDLKITVINWSNLQPANTSADKGIGGVNYPTLFFYHNSITVGITSIPGIDKPKYRYTFYKHDSNEKVSVAGHLTFMDLDGSAVGGNEFFIPTKGFNQCFLSSNTHLTSKTVNGVKRIINNTETGTNNDDKEGWLTATFEGTDLEFIYSRLSDEKGNKYRDMTIKAPADKRIAYSYIMTSAAVAPFEHTIPSKEVSVDEITGTDSFYYTINHFVPGEDEEFQYTSYILDDELPDCLSIDSIEIIDDSGADKSSWFNINNINSHTIKISALESTLKNSNFYNNNYKFKINVKKIGSYDMSPWYDGTSCTIPNKALLTINTPKLNTSKYTNLVNVTCNYNITTYIDNGEITNDMYKISAGSTQTIKFTPQKGYYVDRVVINDNYELTDFNISGDEYTFENISDDCDIKVYTKPREVSFTINKEDIETGKTPQNGGTFAGAEYGIYRDSDCTELVESLVLDDDGIATSSWLSFVDSYEYYVKEIKAPIGYNLNEEIHSISGNGTFYRRGNITINSKEKIIKNNIEINKYLEETASTEKQNLSGVEFTATLINDSNKTYSATTDDNGYCIIKDIPYGTYTITETVVPDIAFNGEFYIDDSKSSIISFTQIIDEDSSKRESYRYNITNLPKKIDITIFKEDSKLGIQSQEGCTLDGAEYTVYKDSKCINAIETLIIKLNDDGTHSATSSEYLVGTYYIKETKAPIGYNLDNNIYTVSSSPKEQNVEVNHINITSKENIIEVEPKEAKVKVLHVVQGTDISNPETVTNVLYSTEEINGKVDDDYITQDRVNEINNSHKEQYELVTDEIANKSGKMTVDTIYVIYEYRTIPAIVKVNYLEKETNVVLSEQVTLNGLVGNDYETQDRLTEINNVFENKYELVSEPENKNGTYTKEEQEVTYYYQKKKTGVIVKYIDGDTNEELVERVTIQGRIDDEYTTQEKEFEEYEIKTIPENASGTMKEEQIEVVYVYSKVKGKIIITKVDRNEGTKYLSGTTFKIEKLIEENTIDNTFISVEKTTREEGIVEFTDLAVGKYKITEIKAPEGYELSKNTIEVEITKNAKEQNILVTNKLKLQLPQTGGKGIYIFLLSGIVFICFLLIFHKFLK